MEGKGSRDSLLTNERMWKGARLNGIGKKRKRKEERRGGIFVVGRKAYSE